MQFIVVYCNKYLHIRPQSEVKEEDLLSNQQGYKDVLTGSYTILTSTSLYGGRLSIVLPDVLAQRYAIATTSEYYRLSLYDYNDAQVKAWIAELL